MPKSNSDLRILHKSHLECFGICVYGSNNPAPSLSAVASLEYSITRLLLMKIGPFSSLARENSAKAARNQKRNVTEKEMRKAAKLVADVASSKEVKIVWRRRTVCWN